VAARRAGYNPGGHPRILIAMAIGLQAMDANFGFVPILGLGVPAGSW
jgi:hypothetical protein